MSRHRPQVVWGLLRHTDGHEVEVGGNPEQHGEPHEHRHAELEPPRGLWRRSERVGSKIFQPILSFRIGQTRLEIGLQLLLKLCQRDCMFVFVTGFLIVKVSASSGIFLVVLFFSSGIFLLRLVIVCFHLEICNCNLVNIGLGPL